MFHEFHHYPRYVHSFLGFHWSMTLILLWKIEGKHKKVRPARSVHVSIGSRRLEPMKLGSTKVEHRSVRSRNSHDQSIYSCSFQMDSSVMNFHQQSMIHSKSVEDRPTRSSKSNSSEDFKETISSANQSKYWPTKTDASLQYNDRPPMYYSIEHVSDP